MDIRIPPSITVFSICALLPTPTFVFLSRTPQDYYNGERFSLLQYSFFIPGHDQFLELRSSDTLDEHQILHLVSIVEFCPV